jgi:hypothetical protein
MSSHKLINSFNDEIHYTIATEKCTKQRGKGGKKLHPNLTQTHQSNKPNIILWQCRKLKSMLKKLEGFKFTGRRRRRHLRTMNF